MRNIKRIAVFFLLTLVFAGVTKAKAYEDHGEYLGANYGTFDYVDVLSNNDIVALKSQAKSIIETTGLDVVYLIQDDTNGKSAVEYSDDFYDGIEGPFKFSSNGIICFIDLDNNENYIGTVGSAIKEINDYEIELILDEAANYALDDYYGCLSAMAETAEMYFSADAKSSGSSGGIFEHLNLKVSIIASIIIGAGVFILHKNACKPISASHYLRDNKTTVLSGPNARFIKEWTTQRAIKSSSSSGSSGGSSHRSSSGRSHGGGGRSR